MTTYCQQDYQFRLELSTKSDTRSHTSCDNNNNFVGARITYNYVIVFVRGFLSFSQFSFQRFRSSLIFANYSYILSQTSSGFEEVPIRSLAQPWFYANSGPQIFSIRGLILYKRVEHNDQLAKLVKHCTSIAEVMGSNPVQA